MTTGTPDTGADLVNALLHNRDVDAITLRQVLSVWLDVPLVGTRILRDPDKTTLILVCRSFDDLRVALAGFHLDGDVETGNPPFDRPYAAITWPDAR